MSSYIHRLHIDYTLSLNNVTYCLFSVTSFSIFLFVLWLLNQMHLSSMTNLKWTLCILGPIHQQQFYIDLWIRKHPVVCNFLVGMKDGTKNEGSKLWIGQTSEKKKLCLDVCRFLHCIFHDWLLKTNMATTHCCTSSEQREGLMLTCLKECAV